MKSNTDQIAAEAWEEIRDLTSAGNGREQGFIAIIKTAIKKAIKEHDKEQHYYAALGEAESRPTHARDGGVCPECGTSWPRHKGLCGGGSAAHASEHYPYGMPDESERDEPLLKPQSADTKRRFNRLREILKERSKGEYDTWGFVAMFMEMIDQAEQEELK